MNVSKSKLVLFFAVALSLSKPVLADNVGSKSGSAEFARNTCSDTLYVKYSCTDRTDHANDYLKVFPVVEVIDGSGKVLFSRSSDIRINGCDQLADAEVRPFAPFQKLKFCSYVGKIDRCADSSNNPIFLHAITLDASGKFISESCKQFDDCLSELNLPIK